MQELYRPRRRIIVTADNASGFVPLALRIVVEPARPKESPSMVRILVVLVLALTLAVSPVAEWDSQHGEVELYDKRGRHICAANPDTGECVKDRVPGRKVEP